MGVRRIIRERRELTTCDVRWPTVNTDQLVVSNIYRYAPSNSRNRTSLITSARQLLVLHPPILTLKADTSNPLKSFVVKEIKKLIFSPRVSLHKNGEFRQIVMFISNGARSIPDQKNSETISAFRLAVT